jgi:hypothetical protein
MIFLLRLKEYAMNKYKFLLPMCAAALLYLLSVPSNVLACACCADPGEYTIHTGKPGKAETDLLRGMKFSARANLFTTAGEENIIGLGNDSENFSQTGGFANNGWKLNFKDDKGKTGTLLLPLSATMLEFKADIHDGKEGGGGGPLLYKEIRFQGMASGTGFFKSGFAAPAKYFLIFQGRGNRCHNAGDFTNWRLEINGKKADYAFYGEMATGVAKNGQKR